MSGGGSGSGGTYNPNTSGQNYDCSNVSINTNLSSPIPTIINQLHVGDILKIEMDPNTGAVAAYYNNNIAGTITHSSIAQLINCLANDYEYIATVVSISGGSCTIHITNG